MKAALNDETNPDTQPVRPPHIPSITNMQLSPSGSSVQNAKHQEYFPGCFPLSPVAPSTSLAHPSTAYCLVMFCDALFAPYLLFLPPSSSPVDPETGADAIEYDYGVDDPSLPEQRGKPPLITRYRLFLLSTACIRVV